MQVGNAGLDRLSVRLDLCRQQCHVRCVRVRCGQLLLQAANLVQQAGDIIAKRRQTRRDLRFESLVGHRQTAQ